MVAGKSFNNIGLVDSYTPEIVLPEVDRKLAAFFFEV